MTEQLLDRLDDMVIVEARRSTGPNGDTLALKLVESPRRPPLLGTVHRFGEARSWTQAMLRVVLYAPGGRSMQRPAELFGYITQATARMDGLGAEIELAVLLLEGGDADMLRPQEADIGAPLERPPAIPELPELAPARRMWFRPPPPKLKP